MIRPTVAVFTGALMIHAAAHNLQLKDVPAPVRQGIERRLNGAEIKTIVKEKEHGAVHYEIESLLAGKHRDFELDPAGALLKLEEEVAIDVLPAAAKTAIVKKIGPGKLTLVLQVTKGSDILY